MTDRNIPYVVCICNPDPSALTYSIWRTQLLSHMHTRAHIPASGIRTIGAPTVHTYRWINGQFPMERNICMNSTKLCSSPNLKRKKTPPRYMYGYHSPLTTLHACMHAYRAWGSKHSVMAWYVCIHTARPSVRSAAFTHSPLCPDIWRIRSSSSSSCTHTYIHTTHLCIARAGQTDRQTG